MIDLTITADDLQNLAQCARRVLPTLTTQEMAVVVPAIHNAEESMAILRKPPEPKPESKPETTP